MGNRKPVRLVNEQLVIGGAHCRVVIETDALDPISATFVRNFFDAHPLVEPDGRTLIRFKDGG